MKKITYIFLLFISIKVTAQIGGTQNFKFLDVPMTARSAALGGGNISIWDDDINLIHNNPSLLNSSMTKKIALNYGNYVSDLKYGYLAYAHHLKQYGNVAASVQFFDYGKFVGYDEFGQQTNNFKAGDYSINLNYAKPFKDSSFNVGVALKTIISQYDIYKSVAIAIDFGVTYHSKKNLTVSFLAKNIGVVYKNFSQNQIQVLPRNLQLGLSYKVAKAPFRLLLGVDLLNKWNLKYISPIDTTGKSSPFSSGTTVKKDSSDWKKFSNRFGSRSDNFMRHITVGAEILVTKNFNLRIAYNYRRQKELTLPERRGANGLSLGFGLKIKRFAFAYSYTKMAFPGNASIFSVTASI